MFEPFSKDWRSSRAGLNVPECFVNRLEDFLTFSEFRLEFVDDFLRLAERRKSNCATKLRDRKTFLRHFHRAAGRDRRQWNCFPPDLSPLFDLKFRRDAFLIRRKFVVFSPSTGSINLENAKTSSLFGKFTKI